MNRVIKTLFYIFAAIVAVIISGFITFQIFTFNKSIEIPNLQGKRMIEASDLLRSKGLYIKLKGDDYDSQVPQGYIIKQDILAGTKVKPGTEVMVTVSKGEKILGVPNVVGQNLSEANKILQTNKIVVGKIIYVHSENIEKDFIIAQRPESTEKRAESFNLIVSLGNFNEKTEIQHIEKIKN